MHPYERFEAWRTAHAMALAIHRATKRWPPDERYGLVAQVRRSAFSVAVNIVEGRARRGPREFRKFLDVSWASLAEVGYTLHYARDLGYLTADDYAALEELRAKTGKPLYALMRAMGQ